MTVAQLLMKLEKVKDKSIDIVTPGHDHSYRRASYGNTVDAAVTPRGGYFEYAGDEYMSKDETKCEVFLIE